MTNPMPSDDTQNNDGLYSAVDIDNELDYATLTDALEQTVFESFDEGLYIGMMSGTSLDGNSVTLVLIKY